MLTDGEKEQEAARERGREIKEGEDPGKVIADAIDQDILSSVVEQAEREKAEYDIDETGAVEAAEYAGKGDLMDQNQDIKPVKKVDLTGTQKMASEDDAHEPAVWERPAIPASKYIKEEPITHVKNMLSKNVFVMTPELARRRDLRACDEHGKLVPDHRRFR